MTSDSDIVESFSKGMTKAVLEEGGEKVKKLVDELVFKFKHGELSFIGEVETVELVKAQRNTAEWAVYSEFVKDKKLRSQIQLGIALRKVEDDEERCQKLRGDILSGHDTEGLHVAQFVQNGIMGEYLIGVMERCKTKEEMGRELTNFLEDIDQYCTFVQAEDRAEYIVDKLKTKALSFEPPVFVVYGHGSVVEKVENIRDMLIEEIDEYDVENHPDEDKITVFFNKNN